MSMSSRELPQLRPVDRELRDAHRDRPAYDIDDDTLDDDPMPIPSTWRTGERSDEDDRSISEEVRAAVLGFVLGVIVVVPTVLFGAGRMDDARDLMAQSASAVRAVVLGPPSGGRDTGPAPTTPSPQRPSVQPRTANGLSRGAVTAAPTGSQTGSQTDRLEASPPLPEPDAAIDGLTIAPLSNGAVATAPDSAGARIVLMQARALIASGDIASARRLLGREQTTADGDILFALAETYDPNVLATWGAVSVSPNPEKARGLYMLSLMAGAHRAKARINALQ